MIWRALQPCGTARIDRRRRSRPIGSRIKNAEDVERGLARRNSCITGAVLPLGRRAHPRAPGGEITDFCEQARPRRRGLFSKRRLLPKLPLPLRPPPRRPRETSPPMVCSRTRHDPHNYRHYIEHPSRTRRDHRRENQPVLWVLQRLHPPQPFTFSGVYVFRHFSFPESVAHVTLAEIFKPTRRTTAATADLRS